MNPAHYDVEAALAELERVERQEKEAVERLVAREQELYRAKIWRRRFAIALLILAFAACCAALVRGLE